MSEEFIDCNPPYRWDEYVSARARAPQRPPVAVPEEWVRYAPGPVTERLSAAIGEFDLTKQHDGQPIGQRVIVYGRVLDRDGEPVPGALLEIWQANAAGRYRDGADPEFMPLDPNFTGTGRLRADAHGRYRVTTIKPAAYAQERGTIYRPGHLHVSVFGDDLGSRLVTQCYFEGDPLLDRDPVVRAVQDPRGIERMASRFDDDQTEAGGYDSAIVYRWDIVLRGRGAAAGQA